MPSTVYKFIQQNHFRAYCTAVRNFSVKADDVAPFPVQRHHVTRLSPFSNYTFVVRAGNTLDDVIAWGDWSDAASIVTDIARKFSF